MQQMFTTKKAITAWCTQMHILEYIIQEDLSLKVYQDVDLSDKNINFLPVQFKEVIGNFYCQRNNLNSLKGVPFVVGKSFNCSNNKLVCLEYSPKIVGEDFICSSNKIISLENITPVIPSKLDCSRNPIKTLKYLPEIGDTLLCNDCFLTTLEGCPKIIKGTLGCNNNKLTSLEGAPHKVGLHLYCCGNPMASLKGVPEYVGGRFDFGLEKIIDFDLSQTVVAEEMNHFALNKEKRINGFEHLYVYDNGLKMTLSSPSVKPRLLGRG